MPTVREIAEFAGVSKSTVSLALNNKPGVSDEMRQMIIDARNTLQARQAPVADLTLPESDALQRGKSALSVVVLHPTILRSSYVFSEVLRGIQSAAEVYNVQLRLVSNVPTPSDQNVAHLYLNDPNLRPDGVLIFGAKRVEPLLSEVQQLGIPCVALGRDTNQYNHSGIGRDEVGIACRATNYLIELGHRKIAIVGGQPDYDYVHNRQKGYRQALEKAGVTPQPEWAVMGEGATATRMLLKAAPDVTGLLFINDSYAAEGLPVLDEWGVRIPDDLSVISFDNTPVATGYNPPLTSVVYRRYEEGQWAVKLLVEQIRWPYIERAQTIFSADFIERASCRRV